MTEPANQSLRWWSATFRGKEVDLLIPLLAICGAYGAQEHSDESVVAFVQGTESSRNEFIERAAGLGLRAEEVKACDDINWVAQCSELTTPITIKHLRIVPVTQVEPIPVDRLPGDLHLIPGMGFGTGHHAATAMCLEFLQSDFVKAAPPKRVLDFGTGSGILAIAACKLFDCAVEAVDLDPGALANAADNSLLNPEQKNIRFLLGDISACAEGFDLVVANVYAEVLEENEPALRKRTLPQGRLILSGIVQEKEDLVHLQYRAPHWKQIERKEKAEWVALLFERM